MKKITILFAFLCICTLVLPVVGWSNSLNNDDLTYLISTNGGSITDSLTPYSDSKVYTLNQINPVLSNSYIYIGFETSSPTQTYFAFNKESQVNTIGYIYPTIKLYSIDGSVIDTEQLYYSTLGRWEFVRTTPSLIKVYVDGNYVTERSTPSTDMYSFSYGIESGPLAGGTESTNIDDISYGNNPSDTAIVSVMPHNWYILKDFLNPNNYGQKDENDNTISTTNFHIKWSIGAQADGWSISAPPDTRYTIKVQSPSGAIAYNENVDITAAGHAYGYVTIPFNATYIGEQPIGYGTYWVTLYDGLSVKSIDYFTVSATGATIYWDSPQYTPAETATVSYTIDEAYWDEGIYTYKIEIKDIYGESKGSYPITTTRAGSQIISLEDYEQGVHYAQLIIAPISTPDDGGMIGYSPMEIINNIEFRGYVNDAETALPLSGANVSATQSALYSNTITEANGTYSTSGEFLMGSAITLNVTKAGYQQYTTTQSPLVTKFIDLNITLVKSPPTYTGLGVGGVVRDDVYKNPVAGMNVTLFNNTYLESYSTTTNNAGYYVSDRSNGAILTPNRLYHILGTKTRFSTIQDWVIPTEV